MPANASSGFADTLPTSVRLSVASIASSILGVCAVIAVFRPWMFAMVDAGVEVETVRFTLRELAAESDDKVIYVLLAAALLPALACAASVLLPRLAVAVIAVTGLAMVAASQFYLVGQFDEAIADVIEYGIAAELAPDRGTGASAFAFLVILVLQAIPALNRPLRQPGVGQPDPGEPHPGQPES